MRAHPILAVLVGWLIGSFFGLGAVMGLVKGVGAKPAPAQQPHAVLLTGFLTLVIGFALLYSGIKTGDSWKKPWQPLSDALSGGPLSTLGA